MRKIFLVSVLVINISLHAQNVGIGTTTPDPNAQLDISSNSKGILIPRLSSTQRNAIIAPAVGLVVFDSTTKSFWYHNGVAWINLLATNSGWGLKGNAGTLVKTNFIGTTDSTDFQIRINNTRAGYIQNNGNVYMGLRSGLNDSTGMFNVGIGRDALRANDSLTNLVAVGDSALANNGTGNIYNYEGTYNTAIGAKSLAGNTVGYNNTGTGAYTLFSNKDGYGNIAAGDYALYSNISGSYNTANGISSLSSNTLGYGNTANGGGSLDASSKGNLNTASGYFAMESNDSGSNNTAIGSFALATNKEGYDNTALGIIADVADSNFHNATAIGAYAQANCNNCMVLGSVSGVNYASSDVNVGIGENSPKYPLSFKSVLGDKISLWSGVTTPHYGFGIQSSLLQIHTDAAGSDIAFGYGSSGAFTETARMRGNGTLQFPNTFGKRIIFYHGATGDAHFGMYGNELRMAIDDGNGSITFGYDNYGLGFQEKMRVEANGFVGIGTNAPAASLHIQDGASGVTPNYSSLILETGSKNNYLRFFTPDNYESAILFHKPSRLIPDGIYYNSLSNPDGYYFRNNGATTMTIRNNGNVGVGTPGPLARLHVADGSVVFSASGVVPGVTGDPPLSGAGRRMMWYADKAAFRAGYVALDEWDKINVGNYSFAGGENTTASGYASTTFGSQGYATGDFSTSIGDGNTASGYTSTAMGFNSAASGSYSMAIGYSATAKSLGGISVGMWADNSDAPNPTVAASNDRLFQIGNGTGSLARSNAITILRNGNVGIGPTNPLVRLHIIDGASGYSGGYFPGITLEGNGNRYLNLITPSNESGVLFGTSTNAAHGGIVYNNGSDPSGMQFRTNGNNTRMVIDASGNVGMGITAPTQRLHVVGNICATGSIGSCSDIRYKTNITPLNHILSSVLTLQGIYYDWKKEEYPEMQFSNNRQIGFSAQEVEKIFPEVVLTDNRGYKSIDYAKLTPVAIEAIKEQQQQIDEMKLQIAELTKTVEKLLKK